MGIKSERLLRLGMELEVEKTEQIPRRREFGAVLMDMRNPFFVELNEGIVRVVNEKEGRLITFDSALDRERQLRQIEMLIDYGVDAIFLAPLDRIGVTPALEKAREAGVPVFNVDTPVYYEELVTSIVASNNYDAGVLNAKSMMENLPAAKIAIVQSPYIQSEIDRTQGFLDTIAEKPEYEAVAIRYVSGRPEEVIPVMERLIRRNPEINVVLATNDRAGLGVLIGLLNAGKIDDVQIYSVDGSPDGKLLVKRGLFETTVAQFPAAIGAMAAELAYIYLDGEPIEKKILIPVVLIDQANVDEFGIVGWQ